MLFKFQSNSTRRTLYEIPDSFIQNFSWSDIPLDRGANFRSEFLRWRNVAGVKLRGPSVRMLNSYVYYMNYVCICRVQVYLRRHLITMLLTQLPTKISNCLNMTDKYIFQRMCAIRQFNLCLSHQPCFAVILYIAFWCTLDFMIINFRWLTYKICIYIFWIYLFMI